MTIERNNRWATPSITHMDWNEGDGPSWMQDRKVIDAVDMAAGNPILVSGDPAMHIVEDAEGRCVFWRASVFIIQKQAHPEPATVIRMTSIAMHEEGDDDKSMQADYADQVIHHLRHTLSMRVEIV